MMRLSFALTLPALFLALSACDGEKKAEPVAAAEPAAKDAPATDAKAEPAKEEAKTKTPQADGDSQHFGAQLTGAPAMSITDLLAEPKKHEGQLVRVEGMVTGVCTKRGCWFDLAGDKPGEKLKFKVKDGTMVFPPDSKGKMAVAEGEVIVKEMTLEQSVARAKHMAEDAGKEFDPASVTEPTTLVMLDGKGATISVKS